MSTPFSYNALKKAIDLLGPRPPKVEIWISDYTPDGQVYKLVLKDLPLIYGLKGYAQGTEVIYFLSRKDFSTEIAGMLRDVSIPVFGPGGERLG